MPKNRSKSTEPHTPHNDSGESIYLLFTNIAPNIRPHIQVSRIFRQLISSEYISAHSISRE